MRLLLDFMATLAAYAFLARRLKGIEDRLSKLENPGIRVNGLSRSIEFISVSECPGGCVYPSYYVGDGMRCLRCGKTLEAATEYTSAGKPS